MQLQGKALRVIIYIGESDHYQGKALYKALLEMLKREGASGATVTRGLAGFGAHSRIHTATLVDLSVDLPIRFEWVDLPETVERLMPQVRRMVDDGLITVEEVEVVQYAPGRRPDPLAQPVSDIMRREVVTVGPETPIAEVVALLLKRGYRSLPVVDEAGRLQGIITDGDLLRRAGLATRLDLQAELSEAQLKQQLASLQQQAGTAAGVMSRPAVTVLATDEVRRAVAKMMEHGLKRLPVVDGDGRLVGWISRVDVLRTLEYHQFPLEAGPVTPQSGTTVAELMHQDVPVVGMKAQLEEIVQALEAYQQRRVVVVDDEQRVAGIITDGDLIRRSQPAWHPGLLGRLRGLVTGRPATTIQLPDTRETAADLMTSPVITVTTQTSLAEALRLMLEHKIKRLPVVDENGRLVGLLGRASLLQGVLSEAG
ncbi:MAG: DUF190 domain-containing protein [Chloroflexi bacterium]|nr:DUF190 domain-containing protein [Chloroflexota bacterium]MCI0579036.1 DUF190 domain-containing protein [Chloroflexota bacterium]MCI0646963.1 DUF190 domain-containing protein [Chloroflexota bacterium]MCI0729278.1 DUF190 domain-containing protein [Chloroflexota bacterium]